MTKILETLKGYRTIIVNTLFALVGVLVILGVIPFATASGVTQELIAQNVDTLIGSLGIIGAAVNVLLRVFTSTPVGSKVSG